MRSRYVERSLATKGSAVHTSSRVFCILRCQWLSSQLCSSPLQTLIYQVWLGSFESCCSKVLVDHIACCSRHPSGTQSRGPYHPRNSSRSHPKIPYHPSKRYNNVISENSAYFAMVHAPIYHLLSNQLHFVSIQNM